MCNSSQRCGPSSRCRSNLEISTHLGTAVFLCLMSQKVAFPCCLAALLSLRCCCDACVGLHLLHMSGIPSIMHARIGVCARAPNGGQHAQAEHFCSTARHQARCVMHTNLWSLAYSCPVTCLPNIGHACKLHPNTLNLSGDHATQHSHLAM